MGFCLFALVFETGFYSNQGGSYAPDSPGFAAQMLDYGCVLLLHLADSMLVKLVCSQGSNVGFIES